MELQIGEYLIPEGCTIKRVGNTIQVYRKKNDKLDVRDYRCRDCKHYVEGHAGLYYRTTHICDMKPKQLSQVSEMRKSNHKVFKYYNLYYNAQKYGMPCDKFELRKEE